MSDQHLLNLTESMNAPFFVYDLDKLTEHLRSINKCQDKGIKLFYATKANPLAAILETLKNNNFGIDVASLGELAQAKKVGFTKEQTIATGPAKSYEYLQTLVEAGVSTIVIESINQLKWLNEIGAKKNQTQNVLLRIQLDHQSEDSSVLGGSSITPFGLSPKDWEQISLKDFPFVHVLGLHCFQWGNILDLKKLEAIWSFTLSECISLASKLGINLKVVDLGGGLGISYNSVGSCGQYAAKIIDIKSVRGRDIIVTEGGINHIARPALTSEAFPCRTLRPSSVTKKYFIHGPLCTALDFLGEHELADDLKVGEWLVFDQTGAYGFTESMPYFLCHDLAGEVIIQNKEVKILRSPQSSSSWNL
jgi:diaminopimelate decarboxylase